MNLPLLLAPCFRSATRVAALTLVDGLVAIGSGLANASKLFLPALLAAMNARFAGSPDQPRRLGPRAFNLEDPAERDLFCRGESRLIEVPGTGRRIAYDCLPRTAVGLSRLETSAAITLGAYAFALRQLDGRTR